MCGQNEVPLPETGNGARRSGLDLVLHAVTFPFDDDGLGMVQEAVEECGGQRAVVIEDLRPLFEHAIGGDDDGAALIALADDLEQQVCAGLVDRQIAQFVQDEERRLEIAVERGLKACGVLGGGQGVDHIHGGGEQDRVALLAGRITQGRGQMGLAQPDAAEEDDIAELLTCTF